LPVRSTNEYTPFDIEHSTNRKVNCSNIYLQPGVVIRTKCDAIFLLPVRRISSQNLHGLSQRRNYFSADKRLRKIRF